MFLLLGTSLKCLSLPEDLPLPLEAQQVLPQPPNPPTIHFLAHTYSFSCQAHSPGLHILEVFLVRTGTATEEGSFPPTPWLLCCFCSASYHSRPFCTTLAPLSSCFHSKILTSHSIPPFSFFFLGFAAKTIWVPKGPQAPS